MHRDDLILRHIPIVKKIARRMSHTLRGDYEEFESAAYLGLVEAASRYDPAKNDNFERWADTRIRGAVFDYVRHQSRLPRGEPAKRKADPDRVNTGPVFHTIQADAAVLDTVPGSSEDPLLAFAKRDVHALLDALSDRNRLVMHLYYFEKRTDGQIGAIIGVTESRVCMLRKELCKKLRVLVRERGIAFGDLW